MNESTKQPRNKKGSRVILMLLGFLMLGLLAGGGFSLIKKYFITHPEKNNLFIQDFAKYEDQISQLKAKLDAARRNLASQIVEADRNKNPRIASLLHWQLLTEAGLFGGNTIKELEAELVRTRTLQSSDVYETAKQSYEKIILGYTELLSEFAAAETLYNTEQLTEVAKAKWLQLKQSHNLPDGENTKRAEIATANAQEAQQLGRFINAITHWQTAEEEWKTATLFQLGEIAKQEKILEDQKAATLKVQSEKKLAEAKLLSEKLAADASAEKARLAAAKLDAENQAAKAEEAKRKSSFVLVPAGSFQMGSQSGSWDERPVHEVNIKRFLMMKKEVSIAEFAQFVAATGYKTDAEKNENGNSGCFTYKGGNSFGYNPGSSWKNPGFAQNENHPVVCMSFNDANAYAAWKSESTGKLHRLPSEAEWEYAARAGTTGAFGVSDNQANLCVYGNVSDQTGKNTFSGWTSSGCTDGFVFTAPVGSFKPNDFGLFDMQGNVWEWTSDCYHRNFSGAPVDGSAWESESCDKFVLRGGSWGFDPGDVRSTFRFKYAPSGRGGNFGFRLVQEI